MSGIVGLWNLDGAPVDPAILARMDAALAHRGPDGRGAHLSRDAALAHRSFRITPEESHEVQPLVNASGLALVLDGRIDNRDELCRALGLTRDVSDAACVLAAYGHWGESAPERLQGDFAFAILDPARRRLFLARDAIGIRPLYYYRSQRLFAFASEIKALLAHPDIPRRPDDDGVADFLLPSARPLDRQDVTCFQGIHSLVPAHSVLVTPDGTSVWRYWDFDVGTVIKLGSEAEYAEAFAERFSVAVRRRIRSATPVSVSVSGGLDSSAVFCQAETLRRAGGYCPEVQGISYHGPEGSPADERQYLVEMERVYGIDIQRIPMAPLMGIADGADEQAWATEAPFVDYQWGVTRAVHAAVRERGARVLLSGHWGDEVLFSPVYLVDMARRFAWATVRAHLAQYHNWFSHGEAGELARRFRLGVARSVVPRPLVPPLKWLRQRLFGRAAPAWLAPGFARRALRFAHRPANIGSGFHSGHARAVYLQVRSKYHVHCMEWNNKVGAMHGLETAFPFLDRDLVGFLIGVPGHLQNANGVPRALARRALRGVVPETVLQRNWKADFTDTANAGVERDVASLTRALEDSLGVRWGYLDPAGLRERVREITSALRGPDSLNSWELADLFGLETWLRVFLGGEAVGRPSPQTAGSVA